ncbi:MAG: FAD-binding oxidoreductase [Parasphingopyxis sp.]|uniref:FAD-binding oxidoreductase n=1 Tax=Parasphingopyxis sp. TaxID=1920299 RepID=UPI0032F04907
MTDHDLLDRLGEALGPKGLVSEAADMAPWLTDWRERVTGGAIAMALPASVEEVQQVVRIAAESGTPIIPQGGNTGMVAGGVPRPADRAIVLSLRRMNAIRSIDPADSSMVTEAGVILSEVHRAAEEADRRFPFSLASKDSATIGGLVSTNAGGTQVLRYGPMRSLVLGIEAVMPDGSLFEGLSSLRKDNRGYDLKQLLIGAEGTLGIVTAASLKLFPAAPNRVTAWAGFAKASDSLSLLRRLEADLGPVIEGFELVPAASLALVLDHIPDTRAPLTEAHAWNALIECRDGGDARALRGAVEQALAGAIEARLAADATIAASEAQAEALWKLREAISEAERHDGVAAKHDISVPVSAMPGFIESATAKVEAKFSGTRVNAFGHLGDGNVHFNVRAPADANGDAWLAGEGEAVSALVHDLVAAEGGSLSAEHGIGQLKLAEYARLAGSVRLDAQRAIKQALDPLGIMNPGKLVPLANPPATP